MIEARETNDLLSLIGAAIDQLRQSVEWFETSSRAEAITCLLTVIRDIDAYMDRAHDDPLLRLANIDVSALATDLMQIKTDLAAVITQADAPPSH